MAGPELLNTPSDTPLNLDWSSVAVGWQRAYQIKQGIFENNPETAEAAVTYVDKILNGVTTDPHLIDQVNELRQYFTAE